MENVLIFVYILLVGATVIAALMLVTFSPVRHVRQPARSLLLGLGSIAVAVLSSIPLALFNSPSVWLWLVSIGVLTAGIGGVLIGLLGSADGINTKRKDDFAPRRGYDKWYGGYGG